MIGLFGKLDGFAKAAWGYVLYLLFVILFGAWVRITGSGAGCGEHWPSCHGEIIPRSPSVETMIEYTHRFTSGILGIIGLAFCVWAWRRYGAKHRVFLASVVTLLFIIFEALIGARIVLAGLVADDDSVARAVVIALHLANTLILTGAAALMAWWASVGDRFGRPELKGSWPWFGALVIGLLAIVATSMSGAVTALGDTLFPVDPTIGDGLFQRVRGDLSPANHFLVRLRIVHPIVAVVTAGYLLVWANWMRLSNAVSPTTLRWANLLIAATFANVAIGVVNVWLHAPGWVQLVHLFIAQAIWISALVMGVSALSTR